MKIVFTKHAKMQMISRGISEDDVIQTINFSERTEKVGNRYYARKKVLAGIIEVVFVRERYIKVITVYPI